MATSLNTMSGIGVLDFEKAQMLFERRASGRTYKVLSDSWTRLQIVPKGDFNPTGDNIFGVYNGTQLMFTIHRNGWRVWHYSTWDVSTANRLNAFLPANFYGVYGVPVVGDNNRLFKPGMFIDFSDAYKYPVQWSGWQRWRGLPHSSYNAFDLMCQDPEGKDTQSTAKLLRLMCYAYVQNYLNYWEQQGVQSWDSFCSTSSFTGYANFDIADRSFKTGSLVDRLCHDEHGTIRQALRALTGASCSVDGSCPEAVNLHNSLIGAKEKLRPFRRYVWGDPEGQSHVQPFTWFNGTKLGVDYLCYEVNRREATKDLLAYLAYGSQVSNQWYVDEMGSHPEGSRNDENCENCMTVYTAGPYNTSVHDFKTGFKQCEDFADLDYDASLRHENNGNSRYVGRASTMYPRVILLDILDHLGHHELTLEGSNIFKQGTSTRDYLFDMFYGFLRSKVSPYFIPVVSPILLLCLVTDHSEQGALNSHSRFHGPDTRRLNKGSWECLLADFGATEETL